MKIIRFGTAESCEPDKDWKRKSLCCEGDISVEHFVKPPGHASPRHQHANAQVLVVLEGRIAVSTDSDGEQELGPGDAAYIPGDEVHVVRNPGGEACVGIDIFVPGRPFDFWLKRKAGRSDEAEGNAS